MKNCIFEKHKSSFCLLVKIILRFLKRFLWSYECEVITCSDVKINTLRKQKTEHTWTRINCIYIHFSIRFYKKRHIIYSR